MRTGLAMAMAIESDGMEWNMDSWVEAEIRRADIQAASWPNTVVPSLSSERLYRYRFPLSFAWISSCDRTETKRPAGHEMNLNRIASGGFKSRKGSELTVLFLQNQENGGISIACLSLPLPSSVHPKAFPNHNCSIIITTQTLQTRQIYCPVVNGINGFLVFQFHSQRNGNLHGKSVMVIG